MKRLIIAALILTAGIVATAKLHSRSAEIREEATRNRMKASIDAQQHLALETRKQTLEESIKELKRKLSTHKTRLPAEQDLIAALLEGRQLSRDQSEQLLADLGYCWNTTGDYLVVSKESLEHISIDGMSGGKVTTTVKAILAITPEESQDVENAASTIAARYQNWARTQTVREAARSNTVIKYVTPNAPELSSALSNSFCQTLIATLGPQRSALLKSYSESWTRDLGLSGGTGKTITLEQLGSGAETLQVKIEQDNGTMSTVLNRWTDFPESLRCFYPGGWTELLQAEGLPIAASLQP